MRAALLELVAHPQNNLRLRLDGQPLWPAEAQPSAGALVSSAVLARLGVPLEELLPGTPEERGDAVLRLLVEALLGSGVLAAVRRVQELDCHDIEGVVEVYASLFPHAALPAHGTGAAAAPLAEDTRRARAALRALPQQARPAMTTARPPKRRAAQTGPLHGGTMCPCCGARQTWWWAARAGCGGGDAGLFGGTER